MYYVFETVKNRNVATEQKRVEVLHMLPLSTRFTMNFLLGL